LKVCVCVCVCVWGGGLVENVGPRKLVGAVRDCSVFIAHHSGLDEDLRADRAVPLMQQDGGRTF
jgi:hypothetical protein